MPSIVTNWEYAIFYLGLAGCLVYGLALGIWEMFRKK